MSEKTAQIGAPESDRKWSQLWFTGKLYIGECRKAGEEPFVLLDVDKGLCRAAFNSLKAEGIDCEPHFDQPHISVLRPEETKKIKKQFGDKWCGALKEGHPMRFRLERLVNLVPVGWKEMDRVWFIECASPELEKYRRDLGLTDIPKHEDTGHDLRFHITFAVRPSEARKAAELLIGSSEFLDLEKSAAEQSPGEQIAAVFNKAEMDPEVNEANLGEKHTNATVPFLLRVTTKLLNVNKGTEDIDDRDAMAHQNVMGPEDIFAERIRKDAGQVGRRLLWKSTHRGNLGHIPSGALTSQTYGALTKSGLGQLGEGINPLETYDQQLRALRLGEGGIGSIMSVPTESRAVQPSHFGFQDPIRAPESARIGVDGRVVTETMKGSDGQLYSTFKNTKTGKLEPVSARQAAKTLIAFPGEVAKGGDFVRAMKHSREIVYVRPDEVDYEMTHPSRMYTATANLVPMMSAIKGGRLLMGSRMSTQALPLKEPEAPLVQSLAEDGRSFSEILGEKAGAVRSEAAGLVTDVGKNGITVDYGGGKKKVYELHDNTPQNRKTTLHNTPVVKIGDAVGPGSLLAHSNFTDKSGTLAIGTNLRAAYTAWKGLNFEDAFAISETASKRLSSEQLYQHVIDSDDSRKIDRRGYLSMFPAKFTKAQFSTVDDNGIVKPGTVVKHGDPLILALDKPPHTAVHRGHKPMFQDAAVLWEHDADGVVTDVAKSRDGSWNVAVKSYTPMQAADKISGFYGDKGVSAEIIPDHKMPHDKDGKPFEILINPQGILTRGNPAQIYEALLGKIARKTGVPYKVPGYMNSSYIDYVKDELSKHGLSDTESITDPETGRQIPGVLTGERYFMKLHHLAEAKESERDIGEYTSEGTPAAGSKKVSTLQSLALLSHNARGVLRDSHLVRGQRNDDYWRALRLGQTPPTPKTPFVYDKFLGMLQGAGVKVKHEGQTTSLFAMTDKDVEELSRGEITSADTVDAGDLKEIPGGLFDKGLTGGHHGTNFSHYSIAEPLPSPVFEDPIRRLLGLTEKQYEETLAGAHVLQGDTGGEAIKKALGRIDVDSAINYYTSAVKVGVKSKRDGAIKNLRFLRALKKNEVKPVDLLLSKVPVLPPSMRPIAKFKGMQLTADANYLYRDLIHADKDYRDTVKEMGAGQAGEARLQLYRAFKAVSGLGDPVQDKTKDRGVKGLLAHVFGSGSPKTGQFQARVLNVSADLVARGVITPNPDLSMDEIGLPENHAWTVYRPFVIRRLVRAGLQATEAVKAVTERKDVAKRHLLAEMEARPVMVNRAPTLHKYGFMAAWPKMVKGHTMEISPVVTGAYGADFDGDAMSIHVPASDEAVSDAVEKMMPSKNLLAARDFKVHFVPKNEFQMGLYLASHADNKGTPRVFVDTKSARAAYNRGEIDLGDRVVVHDKK